MEKFKLIGQLLVAKGRAMREQRGAIDIGGILLMGIGMVFLAVGFIMFPIVTDACDDLLAYTYTGNITVTDATYTGFTSVVSIAPLLVLIGYLSAAVFSMFLGVKMVKSGGSTKLDLGGLLTLGISMIFIAIALIILPVALDGISSIVAGSATGGPMSTTYTGLRSVLLVTPLLILISFLSGSVISGFFGIKKLGASG